MNMLDAVLIKSKRNISREHEWDWRLEVDSVSDCFRC